MSARKSWLEKFLTPERAERRPAREFYAYRLAGGILRQEPIRDISASGAFLVTHDPQLQPGTLISITMQTDGPFELNPARRITTLARVARRGDDGVGLAFLPPSDAHSRRWNEIVEHLVRQFKPKEMLPFLRFSEAIVFAGRIAPRASEEIDTIVRENLSNYRIEAVVDILLRAQQLLASDPEMDKLRTESKVLTRVFEFGSNADEEWLRNQWAGLLAASCTTRAKDDVHPVMVEVFSRLTPAQLRILTYVSNRSPKNRSEEGAIVSHPMTCELDEFIVMTGGRDLDVDHDIRLLAELGLLEMSRQSILLSGNIDLTPTALTLVLHAACQGHRGPVEQFYAQSS